MKIYLHLRSFIFTGLRPFIVEYYRSIFTAFAGIMLIWLFSSCQSFSLSQLRISSRQLTDDSDIVDAAMLLPSINNRTLDLKIQDYVQGLYTSFRKEFIDPQVYELLEKEEKYSYRLNYEAYQNSQLLLLSFRFDEQWGNAAANVRGEGLQSIVFWLEEMKSLSFVDIFIDPASVYQTIVEKAYEQLSASYDKQLLAEKIQPDSNHIRSVVFDDAGLTVFWLKSELQAGASGRVAVFISWKDILKGRELNQVVANELISKNLL